MPGRALIKRRHGQRAGGTAAVSVHVREVAQLFNSLDPAPFWDRDLDRSAAEFIEDEFRDRQSAEIWHLHVHVHVHEGDTSPAYLQQAIESYYGRMANSARLAMREHFRLAQFALMGGVAIFLLSMGARGILGNVLGRLPVLLDEGIIILAWLALWRPAEALIYGWIPLYRNRRLFEKLAGIKVFVRPDSSAVTSSHPAVIPKPASNAADARPKA